MRALPVWVWCVLCATAWSAMASAQSVCIDPNIVTELETCRGPAALAPRRPGSVGTPTPRSPDAGRRPPQATPGYRHERMPEHSRRELRMIAREIEILDRLSRSTRAGDPRRADILRRFADVLAEQAGLEETRARSLDEPIFRAHRAHRDARAMIREQTEASQSARAARERAVRVLVELVRDHPTDARLDESLYTLAFHLETIDRRPQARQVYQRLIRDTPNSRYVPHAYLAFAEHYFEEGDLDEARAFYERVVTIPPERNPVFGYALYKLAWVHYNAERWSDSLEAFVRVIDHVRDHPDARDGGNLARQARRELVLPYARRGRPQQALAFFRRVSPDDETAYDMLARLGEAYVDTGHWPQAIAVHRTLISEQPRSASVCEWQARILDATISSRPKQEQVREAEALSERRRAFAGLGHPREAVRACDERTATALVLLATAWHREAVGTDDQPGTHDQGTMRQAIEIYRLVSALPDLRELRFETIDARDRPTPAAIAFYYADLLYALEDWEACGPAFDAAIDAGGASPQMTSDAAYSSVLCYDRYLRAHEQPQQQAARQDFAARPLNEAETRMARAFSRFSCLAPDHEEIPTVLYRWARIYYEANQFERAAVLFRRVAVDHASSDVAIYAANLQLDSLNVLGMHRGRPECFETLRASLSPLETRHCADDAQRAMNGDLCEVIHEAHCREGARAAETLARLGQHARSARGYLAVTRIGCAEEVTYLHNAGIQFEAARLVGRAIRVRTALIEAHPEDPLARRAVYMVGANYHALAIYGEAATWYERYARESGRNTCEGCPDAAEGLADAVLFRIGLGEHDQALEDGRLFESLFRQSRRDRSAQVVFALGSIYESTERWSLVVDHYRSFLRRYDDAASPVEVARANTAIARAYLQLEQRDRARPYLNAVVELHARGAEDAIQNTPERPLQLAHLRDAVSEALYQLAEEERLRFEAIAFPQLRGRTTIAAVNAWANGELRPWLERKAAALRVAEEAYARVHPLGIPRWRIASASRAGDMVLSVVESVRDAPVPDAIMQDQELLDVYWGAFDEAVAPYEETAIARYEYCLTTATAARWFDDRSRRCEAALHRLDASRFPMAAELRGSPDYSPRSVAHPGPPLDG